MFVIEVKVDILDNIGRVCMVERSNALLSSWVFLEIVKNYPMKTLTSNVHFFKKLIFLTLNTFRVIFEKKIVLIKEKFRK